MQLIIRHDISLPESIALRICSSCSSLLVPGLSCTSRLRSRSKKSRINKTKGNKGQLFCSELVFRVCSQCLVYTSNFSKYFQNKTCLQCKARISQGLGFLKVSKPPIAKKETTPVPVMTPKSKQKQSPEKFSFLNSSSSIKRKVSDIGDENKFSSAVKKINNLDGLDFVKMANSPTINLLELERLRKKQKRRHST